MDFFQYSDKVQLGKAWAEAYSKGTPSVSDADYDILYKELKQFELENPDMIDKESPTMKISDTADGFPKVAHKVPMISIANSNGMEELETWTKEKTAKGVKEYVSEFKIDGLALSLHYESGNLVDAVTRGDGVIGDRVLANVYQIKSIPKKVSPSFNGEIRGEVVWLLKDFEAFQEVLEAEGKEPMANPRNGAAGALKQKDPKEVARRNLSFIAYSVVRGSSRPRQSDDLKVLRSQGFLVSDHYISNTVEEVMKVAHAMEKQRSNLSFLTDGLVIKTNDKDMYDELGGNAKTPHYLTALKFPPEEKQADMLSVEKSAGRTGAVTPVVIVDKVKLAGTTVQRASLHNWDILEFLGIYEGCKVVIRKAGEIIPEVISVVGVNKTKIDYELLVSKSGGDRSVIIDAIKTMRSAHKDKKFILRPTHCQHCNSPLVNAENRSGVVLIVLECQNDQCPVKKFKNIVRFVDKEAMNIFGVSESIVESMLSHGLIKNTVDLYSVTKDDLLKIDGFKERSAQKVVDAIDASRKNYLHQLLIGFAIPNCGRSLSVKLAAKFDDLETISKLTESELLQMPDIGPETANDILDFFKNNKDTVQFFLKSNIAVRAKSGIKKISSKLEGLSLLMTGSSSKVGRQEFKDLVAAHGGNLVSSISKKVNIVLVGDAAGPEKLKKISDLKAQGYPIQVIDDVTFLKMLN